MMLKKLLILTLLFSACLFLTGSALADSDDFYNDDFLTDENVHSDFRHTMIPKIFSMRTGMIRNLSPATMKTIPKTPFFQEAPHRSTMSFNMTAMHSIIT